MQIYPITASVDKIVADVTFHHASGAILCFLCH